MNCRTRSRHSEAGWTDSLSCHSHPVQSSQAGFLAIGCLACQAGPGPQGPGLDLGCKACMSVQRPQAVGAAVSWRTSVVVWCCSGLWQLLSWTGAWLYYLLEYEVWQQELNVVGLLAQCQFKLRL